MSVLKTLPPPPVVSLVSSGQHSSQVKVTLDFDSDIMGHSTDVMRSNGAWTHESAYGSDCKMDASDAPVQLPCMTHIREKYFSVGVRLMPNVFDYVSDFESHALSHGWSPARSYHVLYASLGASERLAMMCLPSGVRPVWLSQLKEFMLCS